VRNVKWLLNGESGMWREAASSFGSIAGTLRVNMD